MAARPRRVYCPAMTKTLLYGDVPHDLADIAPGSVQVSPLVPGAESLEALQPESCDGLVMRAPPNTLERRHEMALALRALRPGAGFVILAAKDKGGTRLGKELASFGTEVTDQPRHHHRICSGVRPATLQGIEEAIADGAPRLVPELNLWSQPGLFSWDRFDIGSAVLIDVLPQLSGQVGDFGCGYGLLSLAALRGDAVTAVIGFDLDRRAIAAACRNIRDPRFRAVWTDLAAKGAGISNLDAIVMNPPFHHAGVEDQALGQALIGRAAEALRHGGVLWLTANRHLPYEAVLKARFRNVRLITEDGGFKIFQAIK
jgi:16S rRNA (guanine1207-N2)-methyltransferase